MSESGARIYTPSKTGEAFHNSDAFVRLIIGPVGGGKSSMCSVEGGFRALETPVCIDGVRRMRGILVRNTYPELKLTTIKTWLDWYPEDRCGPLVQTTPIHQIQRFIDSEGVPCEFEFYFLALDKPKDVKKLLSLEATWIFFDELREISWLIFEKALLRVGRYPAKNMLPPGKKMWTGVWGATNAPNYRHWIVDKFEKERPKGWELYKQPAPFVRQEDGSLTENPDAENVEHLQDGFEYYNRAKNAYDEESFRVYVMNEYGSTFDGKPVFPEYNDKTHRANFDIEPDRNHELALGFDFGRTPACVFTQYVHGGKLNVLEEVICLESISLEEFISVFISPLLAQDKYAGMRVISLIDPAGNIKNQSDDNFCKKVLAKAGLAPRVPEFPSHPNAIKPRLEAVKGLLNGMHLGNPRFNLSRKCDYIHEAMIGGYKYRLIRRATGEQAYSEEPDKNDYSHIMDALQYVALHYNHLNVKKETKQRKKIFVNGVWIDA